MVDFHPVSDSLVLSVHQIVHFVDGVIRRFVVHIHDVVVGVVESLDCVEVLQILVLR